MVITAGSVAVMPVLRRAKDSASVPAWNPGRRPAKACRTGCAPPPAPLSFSVSPPKPPRSLVARLGPGPRHRRGRCLGRRPGLARRRLLSGVQSAQLPTEVAWRRPEPTRTDASRGCSLRLRKDLEAADGAGGNVGLIGAALLWCCEEFGAAERAGCRPGVEPGVEVGTRSRVETKWTRSASVTVRRAASRRLRSTPNDVDSVGDISAKSV